MWPAQRLIASNGIGDAGELSLSWRTFSRSLVVDVLTGEGSWGETGRVHGGFARAPLMKPFVEQNTAQAVRELFRACSNGRICTPFAK
jgi:hypothetical protein